METMVAVNDLKVGMYVKLQNNWTPQCGLEKEFFIASEEQLAEIKANVWSVSLCVDPDRAMQPEELDYHLNHTPAEPPPPAPEATRARELSDIIRAAAADPTMSPDKKANIVYQHCLQLMQDLFDSPTAERIVHTKEAVGGVVDMVMEDDETAINLLKVTNHDFYTYTHSVNVGVLSIALAKRLYAGSDQHNLHELGAGFFLHDLGKVRVDAAIINKPAKLTESEMRRMRVHPFQSNKILEETGQLSRECGLIAMQHHERENGAGYPKRLRGSEIHDYGKICCIADVYDALTAKRSYKPAMPPFKALSIMKEEMLNHFQKELFHQFVMLFRT